MAENKDNFVEGFSLKAEEVKQAKEKTFEIVEEPIYETFEDQETGKVKRRMLMTILFNSAKIQYYPNKTSQAVIISKKGRRLSDWIGFTATLIIQNQRVGNKELDVIYIK